MSLTLYAAGSLRAVLTQIVTDFEQSSPGHKARLVFGASGLLRERLQGGEAADVFLSANMDHPQRLADAGRAEPVQAFARNELCALAAPGFQLNGRTLAQRLLDADVKLGTSTPKADPSGDYAFEMFDRIEASGAAPAGAAARLKARALQLTGGPNSPPPPADRSVYGELIARGAADVFITYCTNARQAQGEQPALQVLAIPPQINVGALYGLALLRPPSAAGRAFVAYLGQPQARARLEAAGFRVP